MEFPTRLSLRSDENVIQLAANDEGKRSIRIKLHTGQPISRGGGRIVFSLRGIRSPDKQVPVLFSHDPDRPIGFSSVRPRISAGEGLIVEATLLDNDDANFVASQADQGLQWQASMGVKFSRDDVSLLHDGETRTVNGAKLSGPAYVIERSQLLEASVLTLGADGDTETQFLALGDERVSLTPFEKDEAEMAEVDKAEAPDPRAELSAYLSEFPADKQGFAAQQFAAGVSLADAKLALANELIAEANKKTAEAEAKLSVTAGHSAPTPSPAAEVQIKAAASEKVDLASYGDVSSFNRSFLVDLLKDEFATLSHEVQAAFAIPGEGSGTAIDNYAAFRRAEARGAISIRNWS